MDILHTSPLLRFDDSEIKPKVTSLLESERLLTLPLTTAIYDYDYTAYSLLYNVDIVFSLSYIAQRIPT